MDFNLEVVIFYALAVAAVLPGLMILITRDIVRVAFWLLTSLSGVAGLYLLLRADFLGLTQILVYIGGIMVLILFGIMMTNKDKERRLATDVRRRSPFVGLLVSVVTFAVLALTITRVGWKAGAPAEPTESVRAIGTELLTTYVLPFEIISVLLLMVLCGAAFIARRRGESSHA